MLGGGCARGADADRGIDSSVQGSVRVTLSNGGGNGKNGPAACLASPNSTRPHHVNGRDGPARPPDTLVLSVILGAGLVG